MPSSPIWCAGSSTASWPTARPSSRRSRTGEPITSGSDGGSRHALLLHGFTGNAGAWPTELLDGLSRRGVGPTAIDLPGHGTDAGASPATLDAALARIDEGLGPAPGWLIGYSMGGRVALHFTMRAAGRVRGLVLESSSPGLATEEERRRRRASDAELAERIRSRGMEAFLDEWDAGPMFASRRTAAEARVSAHRAARLRNEPEGLAEALRGLGTGALPSLWGQLDEVRVPILLIVGARDEKFVDIAERMAARLPDATLEVVDGAGHTVHVEQTEQWLERVSAFIDRTRPRDPVPSNRRG